MKAPSIRVPYLWCILLTLLIAGPWLLPGYVFGTDWPGPRHFSVPSDFSSGTFLDGVLVGLSAVVSAEVTAKVLVVAALFAGAIGAFRALPVGGFIPRAIASVIYVVNPFVYGRIHYGQLALIAAYSLLPWFAASLLSLLRKPGWRPGVILALELTALGVLDLHLLIPAGLLLLAAAAAFGISRRDHGRYLTDLSRTLALALGAAVVASSYWLIPLLSGANSEGRAIAGIGTADLAAYSASADPDVGLIPNLLSLYGFWAEDTGRFTSMKAFVPLWPGILLILIALGALGAKAVIRRRPAVDFEGGSPWVFALLSAGAIALILEAGVATPVTEPIVRFLDTVFPPYRGMRDAGKWAALVALIYAQLIPLGAIVLLRWVREHVTPRRIDLAEAVATGLLLALPLYYGNGLLFGMHGEVQPSAYPTGWYQADKVLAADPHPGRTLFLPWHLYLALGFVRNDNNVVASPAPTFFSVPVVISNDPEVPGIPPPTDPEQTAVSNLVSDGATADWAGELARRNIKYVVVAREVDWSRYTFLASQPRFAQVADYGSIVIYRNLSW
ncbi:MAG: hypothetical protein M3Z28_04690 [Candidatus Dormibacteraeota bacterium]|nr:hypothetical protein [Candidatus Dormibacteraeota bacterium]